MAYEIKFLDIGDKLKVLINNQQITLNKWYSISEPFKVAKKDAKLIGEPFDSIKYISKNGDMISNEALIQINYPPSKKNDPLSTNSQIEVFQNSEYILDEHIAINNAVDRIRITKIETEGGYFTYKGIKVHLNQEIMMFDLDKLIFHTKNGIGTPYQRLHFQVGNNEKYSKVYTLEYVIYGKSFLNDPVITKGTIGISTSISSKIENGTPGGLAKISVLVETNSKKVFDSDTTITINELEIVKPGTYDFDVKLGSEGDFSFNTYIYSEDTIDDGAIYFDLELKSINNETSFIDEERNKSAIVINL